MLLKYFKFLFDKLTAPKYILKGSCKKCGRCCRNIVFFAYDEPIKSISQYEDLRTKNKRLNLFYPSGENDKGEILFTCKSLTPDNRCKHYFFRSMYCRKYPMVKSLVSGKYLTPPDECGYEIVSEKKFEDFL